VSGEKSSICRRRSFALDYGRFLQAENGKTLIFKNSETFFGARSLSLLDDQKDEPIEAESKAQSSQK
jgi:hypothetical protein